MEGRSNNKKDRTASIKVVLVGSVSVGKTCLMMRYADGEFRDNYVNTIGVDFKYKQLQVDKYNFKVQIWDTAGQEKFRSINKTYYLGADAVIVVYDITNRGSFEELKTYWINELQNHIDPRKCIVVALGNKSDLKHQAVVGPEEAAALTVGGVPIIAKDASAKSNIGVDQVFQDIVHEHMRRKREKRDANPSGSSKNPTRSVREEFDTSSNRHSTADENNKDIYDLHMYLSSANFQEEKPKESGCSKC